jgi:predicted Fe-Mo cluster-binding NifX family protein
VITGNVGLNAFQTLSASGIKIITGASGIIREAIERYKNGELKETPSPTVGGHFGMGGGAGRGGGGRGGGRSGGYF